MKVLTCDVSKDPSEDEPSDINEIVGPPSKERVGSRVRRR